jgi:uncharacterized protein involved in exopolysaccharide biosynthesis
MSEPSSFSPRDYIRSLTALMPRAARSAWIGGIAFVIGLAGTVVWAMSAKRLYQSEAVVVYERGVQAGGPSESEGESSTSVGARFHDMLNSRQRLESLIKEMNLYHGVVEHKGMAEAVDEMRKRVKLLSKDGYIFRVAYASDSRDLAQNVLDRLLKTIIEDEKNRRQRDTLEANKFLDAERQHAEADLKEKEGALGSFLTKHPELAAETAGPSGAHAGGMIRAADRDRMPANEGQIAALEVQAAQIEGELAAAGARPAAAGGTTIEDPVLAAARVRAHADVQAAQAELRDKQTRFTNEHPDVKAAMRRLAEAEAGLRRADAALKAAPRLPVAAATTGDDLGPNPRIAAQRRALGAIRSQIAALRGRSGPRTEIPRAATSVVAIDTEWTRLTREVSEARERQDKLESKQFQAQLAATLASGGHASRFVIADAPFRPMRPVAGGRFKIFLFGGIGSVLLALLALAAAASLDDRLYGPRDVQGLVGDGIVVVIPRLTSKQG